MAEIQIAGSRPCLRSQRGRAAWWFVSCSMKLHTKVLSAAAALLLITAAAATCLTIYFLYNTALEEMSARLTEMAQIRAKFIESIAREQEQEHRKGRLEWFASTVNQIIEAHRLYAETESAADLVVATLRDGEIFWISRGKATDLGPTTPLESDLAEPMRRALSGQTGVMEALDYRSEPVLAAYMPALDGSMGVVAKMDIAQVRAPYLKAAVAAMALMMLVVAAGSIAFLLLVSPLIRRVEQNEAQSRREKAKFESLVEATPLGVVWINGRGNWRFVNKRFTDIVGYTLEEIGNGQNWFHLAYPDDDYRRQVVTCWVNELREFGPGDVRHQTFQVRCKDNSQKWIHFRPVTMADGDQLVTLEDITDRKLAEDEIARLNRNLELRVAERTKDLKTTVATLEREVAERQRVEESLRSSEARLGESNQIMSGVLEHTHMMAVYLDRHFNFVWVNRAYARTTGYEPSFFPGKNHFGLYPHEENQAIFQRVVDTGEPYFVTAKPFIFFPDQPQRGVTYWDWSLIPVRDSEGRTIGLVFTLAEVTDRIQAQEALRAKTETLNTIFDSAPYLMMLVNDQGRVMDINHAG